MFFLLLIIPILTACSLESRISSVATSLPECVKDKWIVADCVALSESVVTTKKGLDVGSWSNFLAGTTVSANIPDGYYQSNQCSFEDLDLTPDNIASGINIFGVLGKASGPYSVCVDEALNSAQCSTAPNRYVYSADYGGRSNACSVGLNASACWTSSANQFVTAISGNNLNGTDGSPSVAIPSGYYSGSQTATISDADLLPGNIKSGVNILGTLGNYTGTFSINMGSTQHRDKTENQVSMYSESTINAATAYTNSSSGYRAVPSIAKDNDGFYGASHTAVDRTGWGTTTCGTVQATIDLRIADCSIVFSVESTWNGATKGNAGQGTWRLVTRTGNISSGKGREVWRDERTKLLWSSKVGTAINWCRASGSNFITNNPTAENDTDNWCDSITYQNVGTGPGTKAISGCFEDGENFFTTSHVSIDNAGKGGLNSTSTPVVAWRLPSRHDFMQAEINGIRFVMPDMLNGGGVEWTSSVVSIFSENAWIFESGVGAVEQQGRGAAWAARCVGR